MVTVSIRELTHNFSRYLKEVKGGVCLTILERNKPVAEIMPHNKHVQYPGWKRPIKRRKIKGETFSQSTARNREAE